MQIYMNRIFQASHLRIVVGRRCFSSAVEPSSTTSAPVVSRQQKNAIQKSPEQLHRLALQKSQARTQPTIYEGSGISYALPYYLANKRAKQVLWNIGMGSMIAGFATFVYYYSIWAVSQDDITDEFLDNVDKQLAASMQEEKPQLATAV